MSSEMHDQIKSMVQMSQSKLEIESMVEGLEHSPLCYQGQPIKVEEVYIEYKEDEELIDSGSIYYSEALVLTDPDFARKNVTTIALVQANKDITRLALEEFATHACDTAGCNYGESCIKLRRLARK